MYFGYHERNARFSRNDSDPHCVYKQSSLSWIDRKNRLSFYPCQTRVTRSSAISSKKSTLKSTNVSRLFLCTRMKRSSRFTSGTVIASPLLAKRMCRRFTRCDGTRDLSRQRVSEIGDKIDVNSHLARCSRRTLLPGGFLHGLPCYYTFSLALFLHNLPFRRKERVCEDRYQGDVTRERQQQQQQQQPRPGSSVEESKRERGQGDTRGAQGTAINSLLLPRNCQGSYGVARTRLELRSSPRLYHLSARMAWVGASMRRM